MLIYSGKTNVGYKRKVNEDYVTIKELDDGDYYGAIGDGYGSIEEGYQPAAIVSNEVLQSIKRVLSTKKELFYENILFFLKEFLLSANEVIGGMKMGNEEMYGGFGTSITVFFYHKDTFYVAHAGNTRLYFLRPTKGDIMFRQFTKDHTEAQRLSDNGIISKDDYYINPSNLIMTSGIGCVSQPQIQLFRLPFKPNDIVLLTTDGIHYALNEKAIYNSIISNDNCDKITEDLIAKALSTKHIDNIGVLVIWNGAVETEKE